MADCIVEALYPNSANRLPDICEGLGLAPGDRDEAMSSKRTYVRKRIDGFDIRKLYDLGRAVEDRFVSQQLSEVLAKLDEVGVGPAQSHLADVAISEGLKAFDEVNVHAEWMKALARRSADPPGAITAARSLLETVCKHVLDDAGVTYQEKDDLPQLYKATAKVLRLAPSQHTEEVFRQILGGCTAVVEGLGSLRNRLSDAHGQGRKPARPSARHAQLAVNLAGAMAIYLVSTWTEKAKGVP